jgi:uncharacterized protein
MIKRRYGDRKEWKRVLQRRFAQSFLNTKDFKGYITLLHTLKVSEPLHTRYGEKDVCIVDNGYMWLQEFPCDKHHCVTSMFDRNGNVVQWYIDICLHNGAENDIPFWEDLFLDIVVLPTGELILKDEDELEEAFSRGIIDKFQYKLALNEVETLKSLISKGDFNLIKQSKTHKEILYNMLK